MAACTVKDEREGGRLVLRLAGSFDRASALQILDRLRNEIEDEVVLDFSLIRDFDDRGIATLVRAILEMRNRIGVRGLRQHQQRMLRYIGVDVDGEVPRRALPRA